MEEVPRDVRDALFSPIWTPRVPTRFGTEVRYEAVRRTTDSWGYVYA